MNNYRGMVFDGDGKMMELSRFRSWEMMNVSPENREVLMEGNIV